MMAKNTDSVGIYIISRDTNKILLLHRVKSPVVWSSLSGSMEVGENPMETIKREMYEETGLDPSLVSNILILGQTKKGDFTHYVMIGYVDREIKLPNLKMDENDRYGWFSIDNLPSPIHPNWAGSFQLLKKFMDLRESFKKGFNKLINE
jgi:8-oxo-dGTP pyrophosphatase MutT (NUDIX family)